MSNFSQKQEQQSMPHPLANNNKNFPYFNMESTPPLNFISFNTDEEFSYLPANQFELSSNLNYPRSNDFPVIQINEEYAFDNYDDTSFPVIQVHQAYFLPYDSPLLCNVPMEFPVMEVLPENEETYERPLKRRKTNDFEDEESDISDDGMTDEDRTDTNSSSYDESDC